MQGIYLATKNGKVRILSHLEVRTYLQMGWTIA
jgi:hypothetical protein